MLTTTHEPNAMSKATRLMSPTKSIPGFDNTFEFCRNDAQVMYAMLKTFKMYGYPVLVSIVDPEHQIVSFQNLSDSFPTCNPLIKLEDKSKEMLMDLFTSPINADDAFYKGMLSEYSGVDMASFF